MAKYVVTDAALNNVDQTLVEDLEAALSQSTNLELSENMHAALFPISDQASQGENLVPREIDGLDFVTFFSKINVVRNFGGPVSVLSQIVRKPTYSRSLPASSITC